MDRLAGRTDTGNGTLCIAHAPGNKWPGQEQNQRQQNSITVRAIERIRLREQFGGATDEGCAGHDEEAAENVKAHHLAHAENEDAEQDEPSQELLCQIRGATPIPSDESESTDEQKPQAQARRAHLCRNESGSRRNEASQKEPAEHRSAENRCHGQHGVKVQAERSLERAVDRGPVSRSNCQQPLESKQTRRSSQADPESVPIVTAGHPGPAWQTIFAERSAGVIPRHSKEQRDAAKIERGAQKCANGDPTKHYLERNGGIVGIQEAGDAVAEQENQQITTKSPCGPERDAPPGYRARSI